MNDSSPNIGDLIRSELHHEAASVTPIDNLIEVSTQRGRRKQLRRRMTVATSGVAAAAIVVGGSLAIATSGSNAPGQQVKPAHSGSSAPTAKASSDVTAWWTTWPQGRHFGPVDQDFLTNARPTYPGETSPETMKVWATGSEPDGTDWVLFTSPRTGHILNYLQGWNGQPDFGESPDHAQAGLTWATYFSPTLASHNDATGKTAAQYMIIVGKPGTTSISYAADGTNFTDLTVEDGISVTPLPNGFPSDAARVKLADAHGVYATGTPSELPNKPQGNGEAYGGLGQQGSSTSPTDGPGTGVPTATPTSGS